MDKVLSLIFLACLVKDSEHVFNIFPNIPGRVEISHVEKLYDVSFNIEGKVLPAVR